MEVAFAVFFLFMGIVGYITTLENMRLKDENKILHKMCGYWANAYLAEKEKGNENE